MKGETSVDSDEELFLNKLKAQVTEKKKKTIQLSDCKSLYLLHFNHLSEKNRWEIMATWFSNLKKRHLIEYSDSQECYDFSCRIPLPKRIKLNFDTNNVSLVPGSAKSYQWLPELMFVVNKKKINKSTESKFKRINEFLRKNATAVTLPIKERSLQILGDEKALEALVRGYKDQIDLLEKLNCIFTYEPIHGEIFPGAKCDKLIILENRDTYSSFLRVNHELCPPHYYGIFYGQGNTILNSFPNIISRVNPTDEILYFGDIDYQGLSIAQTLIENWRTREPARKITLADQYYQEIIKIYRETGLIIKSDSRKKIPLGQEYYAPDLYLKLKEILERGERIPQEFLNYEVLKNLNLQ